MMNKTKLTKGRTKICFVGMGAYPLLAGEKTENITGPTIHQVILAKELLKHDFKVSFIAYGDGEVPIEHINGVEIIKIRNANYHLKILNIILKAFRIWNAMRKAKAHIYFQAGGVPGIVSLFCKLIRRKFIYEIASDALVNKNLIIRKIKEFNRSKFSLDTFGNWLDIKFADAIIVQNEYQRVMLKKNFGKDGMIIKMPFPLTEQGMPEKAKPPIVLWVGAMAEVKQPELLVKLAEAIPDAKFQMIGGHTGNQDLFDGMKESSKRIPNFEHLGVIPFDEVNGYFSRASILVNTSMFEGFPHAFIQAWMHYAPVASLNADPDEIICRYKMGLHSKTFNQLIEDVKTLLKNKQLRKEMGGNGRHYVERKHDITKIINKHIEVFKQVGGS
jgi:glycosyltransferase involved in cell wall biosynthesis